MVRQWGSFHRTDTHLPGVVSRNLRRLRGERELSMSKVASGAGVGIHAYVGWEEGRCLPNITALVQLANFYEVSIDYLVGRTEKREVNR